MCMCKNTAWVEGKTSVPAVVSLMSAELSVCIGLGLSVNSVYVYIYNVYTCAGVECKPLG